MSALSPSFWTVALFLLVLPACGNKSVQRSWEEQNAPRWETYKAEAQPEQRPLAAQIAQPPKDPGRFTFYNLKHENDASLATRLLGQNGRRIVYIDRQPSQWRYYAGDEAAIDTIDLYTHPAELGSQYGLCGVEKYSFRFDDKGRIESVELSQRFGIEGDIFQKKGFDWHKYSQMCESASPSHASSYFPAKDSISAHDAALVLVTAIDISASSVRELPFRLECRQDKKSCSSSLRTYLGKLRLKDIDDFSFANCPIFGSKPKNVCFTVEVGRNHLGPFTKYISVRGSTYMNDITVESVIVIESFTLS